MTYEETTNKAYYYVILNAPMACLTLNRLQKVDGRTWNNYGQNVQKVQNVQHVQNIQNVQNVQNVQHVQNCKNNSHYFRIQFYEPPPMCRFFSCTKMTKIAVKCFSHVYSLDTCSRGPVFSCSSPSFCSHTSASC